MHAFLNILFVLQQIQTIWYKLYVKRLDFWRYSVWCLLLFYPVWVNFSLYFVNHFYMMIIPLLPEILWIMRWIPVCNTLWTTILSCFPKTLFILPSRYGEFDKMFLYHINHVQYIVVFHIPRYCTVFTLYDDVCYVPTIWIDHKPMLFQSIRG